VFREVCRWIRLYSVYTSTPYISDEDGVLTQATVCNIFALWCLLGFRITDFMSC